MEAAAPPAPASTPVPQQTRRSNSRSRRSHPSFSDLRLAPLSVPEPKQGNEPFKSPRTPGSIDLSTAHAYRANHASYLAGRSAPSTPGILRDSSRRRQYGGLSRQSHEDEQDENTENVDPGYFAYNAVQLASHGGVPDQSTGYIDEKPKSMSESGLYKVSSRGKGEPNLAPLKTANNSAKRRSHHSGTPASVTRGRGGKSQEREDDWLSHATMFTTSLLAEGKGQSWASSQSSNMNLHSYTSHGHQSSNGFSSYQVSSDSEFDDPLADSTATLKPRDKSKRSSARLSFPPGSGLTYDEFEHPLRSPALSTGWGSRFGSRAASRSNSRRGSRVAMTKGLSGLSTPHDSSSAAYRFGAVPPSADDNDSATTPKGVVPDFVDPSARAEIQASLASVARQQRQRERAQLDGGYFAGHSDGTDDEDARSSEDEKEVARLARTPGFGLGGFGILDRLVGLGNFALDEQDEDLGQMRASDEEEAATPREEAGRKGRGGMPGLAVWKGKKDGEVKESTQEEGTGGWRDAAWLLSVASKVLL
ncbi:hypothetical protein K461DRAFT_133002 [Myriangium duriaei CBS 260.36]|uniref:Uncharacterized protein n=1 Tax=Myriangium duriaei CBS 260.36 TaxID=1168546 RepID=A0A9P4J1M1_9PEZI|nr:hypothetical protein K461DRAFT_133002 [Myriangium duriaei CBS 260.36]